MKVKWYHTRNMSGEYLSPIGWIKYCNKRGYNHFWYFITWHLGRKYLRYPSNGIQEYIGKLLGIKNGYK